MNRYSIIDGEVIEDINGDYCKFDEVTEHYKCLANTVAHQLKEVLSYINVNCEIDLEF